MRKIILIFLLFSFSNPIFSADRFILAFFHGLGGYDPKTLKKRSKIDPDLKRIGVEKIYDIGHSVNKKQFSQVLKDFECKKQVQTEKNLKLIIWGYSWGARKAYEFSKTFLKTCGRKADIGYLVDGIQKPISQFRNAPISIYCKNFYKTIYPIRGRPFDNCQNIDLTKTCIRSDGSHIKGMQCHQEVVLKGYELIMEELKNRN